MVNSWIEWTRENIKEGYPKVTSVAITGQPWKDEPRHIEQFLGEQFRHDRLAAFTDALAPDPAEFATRFTALHYYYTLLSRADLERANPELFQWDDESELESLIKAFKEDLGLVVRLLPVEQCQADWQFIRWEILNSYLIRDWDRALKLYYRAEEPALLERSELQALRGQFRFLAVYYSTTAPREEGGLDSLLWEPVIYGLLLKKPDRDVLDALPGVLQGQTDKLKALAPHQQEELIRVTYQLFNELRLFGFGMTTTEVDLKLKDWEQEWLRAASVELENALEKRTDLPSAYRSILARSYFLTGHFHDAAKQYERLIQTNPSVPVYESLTLSYQQAGDSQKAKEALDKCAEKFPSEKKIYLKKAELQAQEADLPGLAESLRKELERNPELDKDWRLSALLVAAEIRPDSNKLSAYAEEFLNKRPEVNQLIESLLELHWPRFARLEPQAQQEWRAAICLMYYFPSMEPQLRERLAEAAATKFAKTAELELKSKVLAVFRDDICKRQEIMSLVKRGLDNKESALFCGYLKDGKSLTLGQMRFALDRSAKSNEPILQEFYRWLQRTNSDLLKKLWLLGNIVPDRGLATHESLHLINAAKMADWCRDIIEAVR